MPRANPDTLTLLLGKKLGSGVSRDVYELGVWPRDWVVKVHKADPEERDFQNIAEWELWQHADTKLAKWLAPCLAISPGGSALVQARCEPCPAHMIPKKLPAILDDLHDENFGLYRGRVVVHDYGRNLAYEFANNRDAVMKVARGLR